MNRKHFAVIETRRQNVKYEVRRAWKFGSKRYVVALPDSWKGVKYVLVRQDEEGLLIFPLAGIENDAQAAELASRLNQMLEAGEHE
jgi:hypothetical protein